MAAERVIQIRPKGSDKGNWFVGALMLIAFGAGALYWAYDQVRIEVPADSIAVLVRKTGLDLPTAEEVAPDAKHKGIQKQVLEPGRYLFQYNPYDWAWEIVKQIEIPDGKLGVRVRLHGDDLPYGEFLAVADNQKGIVPGVLMPGRYPINPYVEIVQMQEPQNVPAGFKGVVTNLAGPIPQTEADYATGTEKDHSVKLLVKGGFRGVERATLDPGMYYFNPFERRINLVDCRNQRFTLGDSGDLGFPSKDGFWVSLDSIVEFRIKPDYAAQVFSLYHETGTVSDLHQEIVRKVILPAARSFCRLQGSNNLGRDFIQGDSRTEFQANYQSTMKQRCEPLGIEIVQALITKINPPEAIAEPVRQREIAKQQEMQYQQQIKQQKSEEKLAVEKALVKQKQSLKSAEQEVNKIVTAAKREQEVAVTKSEEKQKVAELELEASKDQAEAVRSRGKGAAQVVQLKNKAEAAGWQRAVKAFDGNGSQYAQYVMYQKLSAAYRSIMINTADSPIMKVFENFEQPERIPSKAQQAKSQPAPADDHPPAESGKSAGRTPAGTPAAAVAAQTALESGSGDAGPAAVPSEP